MCKVRGTFIHEQCPKPPSTLSAAIILCVLYVRGFVLEYPIPNWTKYCHHPCLPGMVAYLSMSQI